MLNKGDWSNFHWVACARAETFFFFQQHKRSMQLYRFQDFRGYVIDLCTGVCCVISYNLNAPVMHNENLEVLTSITTWINCLSEIYQQQRVKFPAVSVTFYNHKHAVNTFLSGQVITCNFKCLRKQKLVLLNGDFSFCQHLTEPDLSVVFISLVFYLPASYTFFSSLLSVFQVQFQATLNEILFSRYLVC